jgi:glycerophosphoryl diester phosphodiesterase
MPGRVQLIGHRGQPHSFPDNSLPGFLHVLKAGALHVETDVHISTDGIPVLSHDANLLEITGKQIIISDHSYESIRQMSASFPERFGKKFIDNRIATLKEFSSLLKDWPSVTCFIELKGSSINYFGNRAVDLTMEALEEISSQCVFISFEYEALKYAQKNYDLPLGWVLPEWSKENQVKANKLSPEYLFVDADFCPEDEAELWEGSWMWAVYTVNSAEQVDHFAGLGIELIETNRYTELEKESDIVDVSNDY